MQAPRRSARLFIAVFTLLLPSFAANSADVLRGEGWIYTRSGFPDDIQTKTEFGIFLAGGGPDLDQAFRWMCKKAGGGDFLVLRATGTPAYNPYIRKICPDQHSVSTLLIGSRAAAADPFVRRAILNAEALFISGGDQANYVRFWKDTAVSRSIEELAARHVPVGGTSAGMAVLSEFAFAALNDTVTSAQALADPFDARVTIDRGFLAISPLLKNTITDTHFAARDRMGRLVAFLARIAENHGARPISAIAADENTALLMEPDGSGAVVGKGAVYFLRTTSAPEGCSPKKPLTYRQIAVQRIGKGRFFNVQSWTGTGSEAADRLSAINGALESTQVGGKIY